MNRQCRKQPLPIAIVRPLATTDTSSIAIQYAADNVSRSASIYSRSVLFKQRHCRRQCRQIGAGLLELLVSLFVLAVGLLGVLSLQIYALANSQRALFISEAQLLAADMADTILAHGISKSAAGGVLVVDTSANHDRPVPCAASCDRAQQIDHVHAEWQSALAARLPGGMGRVTWDSSRLVYTVTIIWEQGQRGIADSNCRVHSTRHFTCFTIQVKG